MEKNKATHPHEFKLIGAGNFEIDSYCSELLKLTEIKGTKDKLKGIFFQKIEEDNYELEILKFFNYLLKDIDFRRTKKVISKIFYMLENEIPKTFFKKISYTFIN